MGNGNLANNSSELEDLEELGKLEKKLLGNEYSYYTKIKTPEEMGMSSDGDLATIDADIKNLNSYVQLLINGGGDASKVSSVLGNKYFLRTGTKCTSDDLTNRGERVSRSIYIDNTPGGQINNTFGSQYNQLDGLIPNLIRNINSINPLSAFNAYVEGPDPKCKTVTLKTTQGGSDVAYLTTADINGLNPCAFTNNIHPNTKLEGIRCSDGFQNITTNLLSSKKLSSMIKYLYFISLVTLVCYILRKKQKR